MEMTRLDVQFANARVARYVLGRLRERGWTASRELRRAVVMIQLAGKGEHAAADAARLCTRFREEFDRAEAVAVRFAS